VNGDELTLAFVTSQVSSVDARTDVIVDATDPEFQFTGLKTTSSIRLSKLATVHRRLVQRRLGTIGPVTKREVSSRLRYIFGL
jgi:mRNA interferase MazF